MPLYPYHCRDCNETSEIFARTPTEELGEKLLCQHCGSRDLDRRMSPPRLPADQQSLRGMLRRRGEAEGLGRSRFDD